MKRLIQPSEQAIELALEYSSDFTKEEIQCPRYCKNPGAFFGFVRGYEARNKELESIRIIALINQWAAENCQREIKRLNDLLTYERKHCGMHMKSHLQDLNELKKYEPNYPFDHLYNAILKAYGVDSPYDLPKVD